MLCLFILEMRFIFSIEKKQYVFGNDVDSEEHSLETVSEIYLYEHPCWDHKPFAGNTDFILGIPILLWNVCLWL